MQNVSLSGGPSALFSSPINQNNDYSGLMPLSKPGVGQKETLSTPVTAKNELEKARAQLNLDITKKTYVSKLYFGVGTSGAWLAVAAITTVATGGAGMLTLGLSAMGAMLAAADAACAYYNVLREEQRPVAEDKVGNVVFRVAKFFFGSGATVKKADTGAYTVALPMKVDALANIVYGLCKLVRASDVTAEVMGKGTSSLVRAILAMAIFGAIILDPVNVKASAVDVDAHLTDHLYNLAASLVGIMKLVAGALPPFAGLYNVGKDIKEVRLAHMKLEYEKVERLEQEKRLKEQEHVVEQQCIQKRLSTAIKLSLSHNGPNFAPRYGADFASRLSLSLG